MTAKLIGMRIEAATQAEALKLTRTAQVAPEMQELLENFVAVYNADPYDFWSCLEGFEQNARHLLRKVKGRG
jgi:hypothetical protein